MANTRATGACTGALILLATGAAHAQAVLAEPSRQEARSEIAPSTSSARVSRLNPIRVEGEAGPPLPDGSSRITRSELEERAIEDWDDFAKRGAAGVSYSRGTDSVTVRGVDRDRVVTRIDGIRLPWITDGSRGEQGGLSAVDFGSLSSVDLVKGAGAPASGSLTGYLDLRTLAPDDLLAPGKDFGALVKTGFDSADDGWDGRFALAGRLLNGDTKWLVQAGLRRSSELENMGDIGGYGSTRELRNPEANKQHNLMLKVQHDFNAAHSLTLSGESFLLRRDIDNRLEQGPGTSYSEGQNQTDSELTRQRVWLGYGFRSAAKAPLEYADFKLYWQEIELEGRQISLRRPDARGNVSFGPFPVGRVYGYAYPYGPYGRSNMIRERSQGVVGEWGGSFGGPELHHQWSMGAEWYVSRSDQGSSGYDNCPSGLQPVPPSFSLGPRNCEFLHTNQADVAAAQGRVYSLWFQDEISWHEGRYAIVPALRYDHYQYEPRGEGGLERNLNAPVADLSSNSDGRFSPSVMFRMQPVQAMTLYAKYGYGFKAPSSTQLYMNYGVPGTYLRVGNAQLRPEVSRGWELGLEYGNARRGVQLAVFDNRYRDFIDEDVPFNRASPEWNPAWEGLYPFGVTGYANRSNVRIYGAELSGHWEFDSNWYGRGGVAWARGRDQDTRQYINSVAPMKGILALGYRNAHWGTEAAVTLVKNRDEVSDPDQDFQAPGFGLLDLSAWWKPAGMKGLRLQAGVYNVFDKKYWNALNVRAGGGRMASAPDDYYTEPGRNVRISLSYQY